MDTRCLISWVHLTDWTDAEEKNAIKMLVSEDPLDVFFNNLCSSFEDWLSMVEGAGCLFVC